MMVTAALAENYNLKKSEEHKIYQRGRNLRSPRETDSANYIADMLLELRNMAKTHDLKTLQGLLEISYYEAFSCANRIEVPEGEEQHIHELGADARKAAAAQAL